MLLRQFFRAARRCLTQQRATYDSDLLSRRFRANRLKRWLLGLLTTNSKDAQREKLAEQTAVLQLKRHRFAAFVRVVQYLADARKTGLAIEVMWARKVFRRWRNATLGELVDVHGKRTKLRRLFYGWKDCGQKEFMLVQQMRGRNLEVRGFEALKWWTQTAAWGRYQNLRALTFLRLSSKKFVFEELKEARQISNSTSIEVEDKLIRKLQRKFYERWRENFIEKKLEQYATKHHLETWSNKLKKKSFESLKKWKIKESNRIEQEREALQHYYQMTD